MRKYDEIKEWSYLKYWDVNNLFGWEMSQKLPIGCSKWFEEISHFNENFIKYYKKDSDLWFWLEVDVPYLKE